MLQISAILPAWDTFESVRLVVEHLSRQTVAAAMEVVFVCPKAEDFGVAVNEIAAFHSFQVLEIGVIDTRSRAFAEGVRVARAPLVVLCEDHCFPAPGWAEALIARHDSAAYAAVGPMFGNANPENPLSDADLLMAYGPFLQGLSGGNADFIAGHNSCYRKEVLLAITNVAPGTTAATRRTADDPLAQVLEAEYVFHYRLRAEGHSLYTDPKARVFHMNFATWSSAIGANFQAAKLFGAVRAQTWPTGKRIVFTAAAVAVPFLRLSRMIPQAINAGWGLPRILRTLPALLVTLYANASGEWLGNFQGRHTTTKNLVQYEFHRYRFSPTLTDKNLRSRLSFA